MNQIEIPEILVMRLPSKSNPDIGYKTKGASAIDLYANESAHFMPLQIKVIGTGLFVVIPENWEGQLSLRSSIGARGFNMNNAPGRIDSDYRGEIKIILQNLSNTEILIKEGERIAQMKIAFAPQAKIRYVDPQTFHEYETERGSGGFGSTGR